MLISNLLLNKPQYIISSQCALPAGCLLLHALRPGFFFESRKFCFQLLEVKLPYDQVCLSAGRLFGWLVGRSVGWSVCLSVIISKKGGKLHFHASIGIFVCSAKKAVKVFAYYLSAKFAGCKNVSVGVFSLTRDTFLDVEASLQPSHFLTKSVTHILESSRPSVTPAAWSCIAESFGLYTAECSAKIYGFS